MKTLAICGLATLTILGCVACAQEAEQPSPAVKTFEAPPEHKAFVDEFQALLKKYPEAAQRYMLADMGDQPMPKSKLTVECERLGDFGIDCRPVPQE